MRTTSPSIQFAPVIACLFCLVSAPLTVRAAPTAPASQPATREAFLKLIDRPRVDPAPQISDDGTHFSYLSAANQRVPALLVRPKQATGRFPVVIVLHGTGGTKEGMLPLMRRFADKGFLAVAIDGPYHGARTTAGKGSAEYEDAIVRAWRNPGHEHPLYYDTVWDVMRLIDYLQTRDDVDSARIGLTGISKGGIETYLTAAVDPRVAAAVPCIGVQSFHWALAHDLWKPRVATIKTAFEAIVKESNVAQPDAAFVQSFYDRVAPGLASDFDGPALLPLIAPRPLMMINGDSDDRTPLAGLNECIDSAKPAYHAASADDNFIPLIEPHTGHKVTPDSEQASIDFFTHHLKP